MQAIKFDREMARHSPGQATGAAIDNHRFEAIRMGSSEPEEILGVTIQAKRHGGSTSFYLNGVRTSRAKTAMEVMVRVCRDNRGSEG